MKIEEQVLLNELKNRNYKVYEALFYDYYPSLIRFAEGYVFNRQVCEDIVQSTFIFIWENVNKIEITSSFKAYLYTTIKNKCLNHLRAIHIQDKHNLLYLEATLNSHDTSKIEDPEILKKIDIAISELPEKMANIFKLKYLQGKKNSEVAEILQVSENTVKTQLQRAKFKLRKLLAKSTAVNFIL
ncbi:MAG: RNA polymerase sigma-70 factor [Bacteroidales bacterium]|nr:RNA polymerase sigma-70 factor [Bacteroidales bacterium]